MNVIKIASSLPLLCFLSPLPTLGNQLPSVDELIHLSLEELMQVQVVTASKTANTLSDTPGVMSVVTAEEITRYGANNLFEVLERVTSVYMTGSYMYPQATLAMRGDLITHHDNHILILINGRPTRETIFGGFSSSIYLSFPVSMIDRLEIIRGPGSALYGTNAYTGVINIITKENVDGDSSISVTGGSLRTLATEAKTAFRKGDFKVGGAVKTFKEGGWNFHAVDEAGDAGETQYGEENYGAFGFGNYKNLKMNMLFAKTRQDNWGNRTLWEAVPNTADIERKFLDVGYEHPFSETWKMQLNATYNDNNWQVRLPTGPLHAKGEDWLLEMIHFIGGEKFNWLVGGTVYLLSGESKTQMGTNPAVFYADVEEYEDTWYSLYGQADYRYSDTLHWFLGGQVIKSTGNEKFVPRLGIIYNLTPEIGVKLLYSQAFRTPFRAETAIKAPGVLFGNPNLRPETVTTLDLQWFYNTHDYQLSATYFNSVQRDLIVRQPDPTSKANIHINHGELKYQGVELQAKWVYRQKLLVNSSLSYQINEDEAGQKNYTAMPNWMAKIGVSYDFNSDLSVGWYNSFFSSSHDVITKFPNRQMVNPKPEAFNLMTFNINVNLQKWLATKRPILLKGYVYNVLDEEVYTPEYNRGKVNSFPDRQGRGVYLGIQYNF